MIKYWQNECSSHNYQMFQLPGFSGVINFILYVRLESFHGKLFHVLSIIYSLNCVILIAHFPLSSFFSALFFRTNTYIGKECLTLLFTLKLKKISCPLIFTIRGKFVLVLKNIVRQHLLLFLCNIESRDGTV